MLNLQPNLSLATIERRRHQRIAIALPGRYMLSDKRELFCKTVNISPGGALVIAEQKGSIGENVVFYFETLGRIEGAVVRHTPDGFAFTIQTLSSKRTRLANLLTWLAAQELSGLPEDRRHQRIAPNRKSAQMTMPSGEKIIVEIADVSISGVGLISEFIPEIGTRVEIGRRTGKVVRHFPKGLALEFSRLIPIEEFDEDIIL